MQDPLIRRGEVLLHRLRSALAEWRRHRERARALRQLRAWDDRMLKDIGLGRSEIRTAVDGGAYRRRAGSPPGGAAAVPSAEATARAGRMPAGNSGCGKRHCSSRATASEAP